MERIVLIGNGWILPCISR